ncbi:formate--tetrahydrofolate ligase, partial [Desulforudis sp. 1190]|uniref:formate--tetrahydrofolate ligase n=1 Tax=Desulforudis sp. 1190 TaxID=3416136 RepID=UPI003CF4A1CB
MKFVPTDLEIAQAHKMIDIREIAESVGLTEEDIDLYGRWKAKIGLHVLEKLADRPTGKLIDVTAITPTPLGEGKTVTTIGLTQGLGHIGKRAICTIRQPSMGPVFGIKGGAAGGGYAQVVPMEDLNLHFTGDIHAVGQAHNQLAAMIDASILHGNPLNIDPLTITWNRVVDVNDRALRDVIIGLGGRQNGYARQTGFEMTVASEVMAALALATGIMDLRRRLGRMVVAYTYEGRPVTAEQLRGAGAMAVILRDAVKPNLIQTLEGQPCIVHAGPFANIAHGQSSVLADLMALKMAEYVVTESGFGADLGMEKFMDIKCRQSGLRPNCVVINATVRALKMHGGAGRVVAGRPLPEEITCENLPALEEGCRNLAHMIKIAGYYGVPVVVSINRFVTDTDAEVETVRRKALEAG